MPGPPSEDVPDPDTAGDTGPLGARESSTSAYPADTAAHRADSGATSASPPDSGSTSAHPADTGSTSAHPADTGSTSAHPADTGAHRAGTAATGAHQADPDTGARPADPDADPADPGATSAYAAADSPTSAMPGGRPIWRVAGRYRVISRIGAGGMADVMRARDELLHRDVAVKVFRATPPTPDTASGVERQEAELHALARLNHPNLTMLFDGSIVGQDGPAYLVMELIDGPSLAQVIEAGGLPEKQIREVGAQLADALAYVHAAGMVHRDVKPANILLGQDRTQATESVRARLTDFGIVRLIGNEPMTRVDMTLGSASYLAPEQARGSAVGPPADVYALGLSLIEALTGRRSFDGPPMEAVLARLSADPVVPPDLPQPWPPLLRAMTARDPNRRPTAHQVAETLRGGSGSTVALGAFGPTAGAAAAAAAAADTAYVPRDRTGSRPPVPPPPVTRPPVTPPPAEPPPYDPPPARVRGWLIAAGVVAALLIIIGVIVALASNGGGGSGSPSTKPSTSAPRTSARSTPSRQDTAPTSAPVTQPSTPSSTAPSTTPTPTPTRTTPSKTPTPTRTRTSTSSSPTSSSPATRSRSRSRSTTPAAGGAPTTRSSSSAASD